MNQETFEADHARIPEPCQLTRIARHDTAPECRVNHQLAAYSGQFCIQSVESGRGWNTVERHVDDRGYAAGRSRSRGGSKTFPLSPAGLVDMHVTVDQARHYDRVFAGFNYFAIRRNLFKRSDGADAAGANMAGRRHQSIW